MDGAPTQAEDIEIVEVADGYVVYAPERDRVHFFNHTAAVVLELCDGTKSDDQIATVLQRCYELPDPPLDEVAQCLAHLREESLVV